MQLRSVFAFVTVGLSIAVLLLWLTGGNAPASAVKRELSFVPSAGSPMASPFSVANQHVNSEPYQTNEKPAPVPLAKRIAVAPGSKSWRFEQDRIGKESAASLYARIAQRPDDPANYEAIADFAEVMLRCRLRERREMRQHDAVRKNADRAPESASLAVSSTVSDRDDALCSGAPADAVTRSDQWLSEAAESGDPRARYLYSSLVNLAWLQNPQAVYKNPERLVDYKPKAFAYLGELAAQGHVESLERLSLLYMHPAFGDDRALSWAYAQAASKAENNHRAQAAMRKRLEGLPEADRARAVREAETIYARCCQ
jgi:hypothetical protein